jgi:hypothetical protein
VYSRAPSSWQVKKYFPILQHTPVLHSATAGKLPSLPVGRSAFMRLHIVNSAVFADKLKYFYTARGSGKSSVSLPEQALEPGEEKGDKIRLDKLRKDLVFMWRSHLFSDISIVLHGDPFADFGGITAFRSHRFILVSRLSGNVFFELFKLYFLPLILSSTHNLFVQFHSISLLPPLKLRNSESHQWKAKQVHSGMQVQIQ